MGCIFKGVLVACLSVSMLVPTIAGSFEEDYQKYKIYNRVNSPNVINISIDSVYQDVSEPPYIEEGRTMVPLRIVTEGLKCKVDWDAATKTVTIISEDGVNTIVAKQGSKEVTVNGEEKALEVPVVSKSGKLFVPLRFIAENLKCRIGTEMGQYSKEIFIFTLVYEKDEVEEE